MKLFTEEILNGKLHFVWSGTTELADLNWDNSTFIQVSNFDGVV